MNNIRVLKNLVEIRVIEYKGYIEINLEGNDILKKKSCRDIYRKWMNPNPAEYQTYSNNHKSSKRHKSQHFKYRDNSLLNTNRTATLTNKNFQKN
jgi:hypothetical protein